MTNKVVNIAPCGGKEGRKGGREEGRKGGRIAERKDGKKEDRKEGGGGGGWG